MGKKIEKAVQQMESWAKDPAHGYDQTFRWGEKGDYDCSSSIIEALERAGIPAKTNGATYTGNMYQVLTSLGFVDVTDKVDKYTGDGVIRGDILLNHVNHVAMSVGNGKIVQASINELGTSTGGQPGDQTGTEFYIRFFYSYPWDCVLRYVEAGETADTGQKTVSENVSLSSGSVPFSDIDIECAGRIKRDVVCRIGIGEHTQQAGLFPMLRKGALVDIVKGTRITSEKGVKKEKWVLVRIAHPEKGFVCEYIPYNVIGRFSDRSD